MTALTIPFICLWGDNSRLIPKSHAESFERKKKNNTLDYAVGINVLGLKEQTQHNPELGGFRLCLVHLVTHTAYGKREIKIASNVHWLVLQGGRNRICSGPVTAEQDSALLGRENFGVCLEQG